jgi:hypothetical protein
VHQHHTIVNFVIGELQRYAKCNSNELYFLKNKLSFYKRLRNRGYKKSFLNKTFGKVSYNSRLSLLSLHVSALGVGHQEEVTSEEQGGMKIQEEESKQPAVPSIMLKMGGQFIILRDDFLKIFNKEICYFSSICPIFKDFAESIKISIVFCKSPNIGNLLVKTKL